jgi:hypothetical protein
VNRRVLPTLAIAAAVVLSPLVAVPTASAAEVTNCYRARVAYDLNGDGYEDAVVGDPYATVNGQAEAGTVTVLFGDSDGRIGEGTRRVLSQTDLGETPEAGDHFGWSVFLNETDSGGCYGILIGSPGEDIGGAADAGMAHTYTFNGALPDETEQHDVFGSWDQSETGGTVEAGDEFGYSVASIGGSDEYNVVFAFGAPGENDDAGVVNIIGRGEPSQRRQGSAGVPGSFQAGDRFGEKILFTQYLPVEDDDDWYLYVGAPGDVVSGKKAAGSVTALSRFSPQRLITQNTSGVPGTAETGDRFGSSIAGNKYAPSRNNFQLAVGSPGEDLGSAKDAGTVTVLKRSFEDGVLPAISLSQSTKGVAGTAESGDQFGAAIDYRDDRTLAIGIPGEDLGSVADAGSVQIVRVGKSALSFPSPSITEDSPGTPGAVQANSRFGSTVAGRIAGRSEAIFALSSPFQDGGSVYVISSDSSIAPRSWKPGVGGIPGVGVRFGLSVA